MQINAIPYPDARLPFANEDEVQRFVERHAEKMLGVSVLASSLRGGCRLCDIDILGVDGRGTPVIIECKWDRVDAAALRQLAAYSRKLQSNWPSFETRVREIRPRAVSLKRREPILVTIGYRYDRSLLAAMRSVVCLTYSYHGVPLVNGVVGERRPGKVSIQRADRTAMPRSPHSAVSKQDGTDKRLAHLPKLRSAFWALDRRLRALEDVTPHYYKNVVHYRVSRGQFAEAKIRAESIAWSFGCPPRWRETWRSVEMLAPSDAENVFRRVRRAYRDAS